MKKYFFAIFLIILGVNVGRSQNLPDSSSYPEVGKPMPDFELNDISYFIKKRAALKDFHGKWLLLDFWEKNCGGCIASFPRINKLQQDMGGDVQLMLIGTLDPEKSIKLLFSRYRKKEGLTFPCAFDSVLWKRFGITSVPRIFLIDPNGIVRYISSHIDATDVRSVMHGDFASQAKVPVQPFADEKPFMIDGNGAIDSVFLFRSILSAWKPDIKMILPLDFSENANSRKGRFLVTEATIGELYFYAYFGMAKLNFDYRQKGLYDEYYYKVEMHLADSSKLVPDFKTGKNCYCYNLEVPSGRATKEDMQKAMQADLKKYWGFDARFEEQKCPYWKIIASKSAIAKLKSKGGSELWTGDTNVSYKARNAPFEKVVNLIRDSNDGIFIDDTGIDFNVDITMDCKDCLLTNLPDVKKALMANGLDLIAGEKEMKVLVIKDPAVN